MRRWLHLLVLGMLLLAAGPTVAQTFVGYSNVDGGGSLSSLDLTPPTGTAAGDILIAQVRNQSGRAWSTGATGWTKIREDNDGTIVQAIFWKLATASEPASYNFTVGASARLTGSIYAFRGLNTSTPVDVSSGGTNSASPITAPSLTTTVAGDMVVVMYTAKDGDGTITPPAGVGTVIVNRSGSAGYGMGVAASYYVASVAGTQGAYAATLSNSKANAGQILALRAASPSTCGVFGAAVNYPVYGSTSLAVHGTVNNGTSTYTISGSGTALNQNSGVLFTPAAPTFPALSPPVFPSNASVTDSSATSLSAGSYRTVTVGVATTFAAGNYSIKTLNVSGLVTVNLGAGTYNIDSVTGGDVTFNVSSGPVQINIGTTFNVGKSINLNVGGSPQNLRIYLYPGANFTTLGSPAVTGLIYAPDSASTVSTGDAVALVGAIIGRQVSLGTKNDVIMYWPATQSALAAVSTCGATAPAVDHYELSLPSTGVSCVATTATVTACADTSSPCTNTATTISGQTATLATSAGSLAATALTFNASGVASTTLSHAAASNGGAATVTLSGESTAATNSRKCCADGSSCSVANSCGITYSTAGFVIAASTGGASTTLPTQTAGTSSSGYFLRAVKTGTSTQACEAALSGANTVNWSYQCNNPTTCSSGNRLTLTGSSATAIAGNANGSTASSTSVAMTFDANGNAPFSFNYADVGQLTLYASKAASGTLLTALSGNSNAFVTKPAGFVLSSIKCSSYTSGNCATSAIAAPGNNPAAASAGGTAFMPAGAAFSATVTAVDSGGSAVPNYGRETSAEGVLLTPTLVLPAGGATGTVGNANAFGSFSSGVATGTTFSYSEVGIVTLTPSVADGSYLGAGDITGTVTGNVGRFYPAKFAVSSGGVTHRSGLSCSSASAFSYLGENFRLGLTLTAQNASGATTANYTGSFAKFDATSASAWQLAGVSGSSVFTTGSSRLSLGSSSGSWSNGVMSNALITASASRAATPDGPFASASFGVAPLDSDGVTIASPDLSVTSPFSTPDRSSVASLALRFGRLRLSSAIGPADRALALPALAQYWDGTSWATNTLDSCTTVAAASVSFGNLSGTLTVADTAVSTPITISAGSGSLRVPAPGGGRSGAYSVALSLGSSATDASCMQPWTPGSGDAASAGANLSYLRGAWCSATYDKDPAARASLGRASGNDKLIFRRENY